MLLPLLIPDKKTKLILFASWQLAELLLRLPRHCFDDKILGRVIPDGWEKWLLDLAAIATVADSMPLIGENRTIVKYGLVVLAQTKKIGLRELMRAARIEPVVDAKLLITNLDAYTLGFVLGPRLNAAGRMGHASTTYKLLITEDSQEAEDLAQKINSINQERQKITDKIIKEIEARVGAGKEKVVFEGDENWPIGIVGLIAGRLRDKYCRPAIIYQKMEGMSRGSARSIDSFNIIDVMFEIRRIV